MKRLLFLIICLVMVQQSVLARDAAFVDPNIGRNKSSDENAISVEPKNEIDLGETPLNVARRTTLFFINQTGLAVDVTGVTTNADGNVNSQVVSDDCTKEGKITAGSRCSIVSEITPITPGSWSAEVLLTHNGIGRIAKARLYGKVSGQSGEKKEQSLAVSRQENQQIAFGDVAIGDSRAVRSAVMVNDSPELIKIASIDVIAAENGLERLDQGCKVDLELKPGDGCPVTLVWQPIRSGQISTDVIIRHSGKLGFVVIPVRGIAKGETAGAGASSGKNSPVAGKFPALPPTAMELEKLTGVIPPLDERLLPSKVAVSAATSSSTNYGLIGTVGNRAIILKPDGTSIVVAVGDNLNSSDGQDVKLTSVTAKTAEISINGKKRELGLQASGILVARAAAQRTDDTQKNAQENSVKVEKTTPVPSSVKVDRP
jgi:hypothetical protein